VRAVDLLHSCEEVVCTFRSAQVSRLSQKAHLVKSSPFFAVSWTTTKKRITFTPSSQGTACAIGPVARPTSLCSVSRGSGVDVDIASSTPTGWLKVS